MKQVLFFLSLLVCQFISAQEVVARRTMRLDANTVVKDSTGRQMPYSEWHEKVVAGTHSLRTVGMDKAEFWLIPADSAAVPSLLASAPPSPAFPRNKTIKLFKVKDVEGETVDLRETKGKITVLNFWFIDCPPCRREIPELNKLVEQFKGRDSVRFVSIALDSKQDLRRFLKENPFHYRVINDGRFFAQQYGVVAYPTHVVIDEDGKVAFSTSGYGNITIRSLRRSIEGLLGE